MTNKSNSDGSSPKSVRTRVTKKLLSERAVSKLQKKLALSPEDLNSRCLLLSHYFQKYFAGNDIEYYVHHLRWFIENLPEHPILRIDGCASLRPTFPDQYKKLKQVWLKRLSSSLEASAYDNAAAFFISNGDLRDATKVLTSAKRKNSRNPHWLRSLARVYLLSGHSGNLSNKKKALKCYQEILMKFDATTLDFAEAASLYFQCSRHSKAEQLSKSILASKDLTFDDSFAIHMANTILGQIALRTDDTKSAVKFLHASISILHPILLCIKGFNSDLAKELVEHGYATDVSIFLMKYRSLCPNHKSAVDYWSQAVKVGRVPDDWRFQ